MRRVNDQLGYLPTHEDQLALQPAALQPAALQPAALQPTGLQLVGRPRVTAGHRPPGHPTAPGPAVPRRVPGPSGQRDPSAAVMACARWSTTCVRPRRARWTAR